MRDFDKWYADARVRHTSPLWGVDYAAIRAEFHALRAAERAASDRRATLWLKAGCAVAGLVLGATAAVLVLT